MIAARNNPFATERVERLLRYEPAWIGRSWGEILSNLDELKWRAAVVGPHGSGKTTFLDALADKLAGEELGVRRIFLNGVNRRFDHNLIPNSREVVLLDGAEQLSAWAWLRFQRRMRSAKGVVITTHRSGRLPTLLNTAVTPAILRQCVERLDPRSGLTASQAEELLARHQGNVRHALLECYDSVYE